MSRTKKVTGGRQAPKRAASPTSVFKEAWENINRDFNRLLPETLRKRDKKKFVLWLFILEILVLGTVGKVIYDWLAG